MIFETLLLMTNWYDEADEAKCEGSCSYLVEKEAERRPWILVTP